MEADEYEYQNPYYWGACPICGESESLRACARCKLIYYCSKTHQQLHWKRHKLICKCIQQLLTLNNKQSVFRNVPKNITNKEWNVLRTKHCLSIELIMGRKLFVFERQMFLFPRVCEVCKVDDLKNVRSCDSCKCVSYCSDEHQAKDIYHSKNCQSLKLCKYLDLNNNGTSFLTYLITFPHSLFDHPRPQTMDKVLDKFNFQGESSDILVQRVLCSEFLSCPLTLLFSIDYINKFVPLKNYITIHVVGASRVECSFLKVWDLVQKWFSQKPRILLVFIGPEIPNEENNRDFGWDEKDFQIIFYKGYYHDYLKSQTISLPDFIVAFNCGLLELEGCSNDTWCTTLPYFFKGHETCIILTSYTQFEAFKDLEIAMSFSNKKSKVLLNCVENPFRSLRPHRNWENISSIFYFNNYFSVIQVNS